MALWLTVSMDTHPDKTVFHTCWSCDNSEDIQIRHVVYEMPTYLAYRYFCLFSCCFYLCVNVLFIQDKILKQINSVWGMDKGNKTGCTVAVLTLK